MNRAARLAIAAIRRAAGGLLLLVGATFVIYITIRSAPGDAIDAISPMGTPPDVKARLAAEFGLDRDPLTGYVAWLGRLEVQPQQPGNAPQFTGLPDALRGQIIVGVRTDGTTVFEAVVLSREPDLRVILGS